MSEGPAHAAVPTGVPEPRRPASSAPGPGRRSRHERAELLVADIGSTLTKVSAFAGLAGPAASGSAGGPARAVFLGQGVAVTTVAEGDVERGLEEARRDLERRFGLETSGARWMASSSAAGGLRMTVHGLTRDMTLRAAREASLGAGARVAFVTAGELREADLAEIGRCAPRLILLAGGVDFGARGPVVSNARALASLPTCPPVLYAGNRAAAAEVEAILKRAGVPVFVTENVYPRIDELHVEPARLRIQEVFARHIVNAPGMEKVKARVEGELLPTPAAVLRATELLAEEIGDVLTVDVGGATTDVHSVTDGSARLARLRVAPEPRAKRTVEGDLGVYWNAAVVASAGSPPLDADGLTPLAVDEETRRKTAALARRAAALAVWRHAGERRTIYGAGGPREIVEGRDLTAVRTVVGTGGVLSRLPEGREGLASLPTDPTGQRLLPPSDARVLIDAHYVMAAVGVLCRRFPGEALALLRASLGLPADGVGEVAGSGGP